MCMKVGVCAIGKLAFVVFTCCEIFECRYKYILYLYLCLFCISACGCQRASQLANVLSAAQALVVDDVLSFGPFKLNVSIGAIFEEENFFTLARHDFNAIIGFARRIFCVAVLV